MNGNDRCLPDGRIGMQRPRKIKNVKKKIHASVRKVLSMGQATLSGPVAVDEERFVEAARNSVEEKKREER